MTSGGSDGLSLRHGDGPPDDEDDGQDGEFYIDIAAWDIYGPKDAGAWGAGGALIGPPRVIRAATVRPARRMPQGHRCAGEPASGPTATGTSTPLPRRSTARRRPVPGVRRPALPGTAGAPGDDGDDGSDGRNPEFRKTATHLEWRLAGDVDWTVLVALAISPVRRAMTATRVSQAPRETMATRAHPAASSTPGPAHRSSGLGANGDWYFDTAAKAVHGKSDGTWGSGVSVKGDAGDDGANGASIHYGSGAPSSGLGADGDAYIDEATMAFYRTEGRGKLAGCKAAPTRRYPWSRRYRARRTPAPYVITG